MGFFKEFKKMAAPAIAAATGQVWAVPAILQYQKNKEMALAAKRSQQDMTIVEALNQRRTNMDFRNRLEEKRQDLARRTQTVYAGMLKKDEQAGLGGQKTLLGI